LAHAASHTDRQRFPVPALGQRTVRPDAIRPKKARQLLAAAGYANGFDAGDCTVDIAFTGLGEATVSDLVAVSGVGLIPLFAFSGPYEDVQVKS
jgi:hypothetical protein